MNPFSVCGDLAKCNVRTLLTSLPAGGDEIDKAVGGDETEGLSGAAQCCARVRRGIRNSPLCGPDSVEYFDRGASANDKDSKRKKGGRGTKNLAGHNLRFGLPALDETYKIVEGKNLGILRQALHKESRQRRAILTIPKKSVPTTSDDVVKEVRNRIETLLKIDHVNVLAMHEAREDLHYIYLVYDWPDGGLMLEHFTSYHEDVTEAHLVGVTREVLAATAAANTFNIHHLDWSLLCLFLGYRNRTSPVKVMGFGLAGVLVHYVTSRKVSKANKHFYASPEMVTENPRIMPHSKLHVCDVWSIGTLVYMLFCGRPPFYGPYAVVIERIKRGTFTFGYEFDTISRESKDGIEKMLTKKWELRPTATDLLKHPFLQQMISSRRKDGQICQDALTKLDAFAKETHCKQTLARLLADLGLQESQYSSLEDKFRKLDLDGNGVVEVSELSTIMASLVDSKDHEAVSKSIAEIIKHCDRNNNATVDISEFVAAVVLKLDEKDERLLVKAFEKMDMNRDARITKGELFKVLRQYSDTLNPEDVTSFVKDWDTDMDQKIDYNEFKHLFGPMREKDEEMKEKHRKLALSSEQRKQAFATLQSDADKFTKNLKVAAGNLAQEYMRMHKHGGNEHMISTKLKAVIDVVKDFAGRTTEADAAKAKAEAEKRDRGTLCGLTMMHKYKDDPENDSPRLQRSATMQGGSEPSTERRSPNASDTEGTNRGTERGHVPKRGVAADPTTSASVAALAFAQSKDVERTVAEEYIIRSEQAKGRSREAIRKIAKSRRRYLWLGIGEGMKKMRATTLAQMEQQYLADSNRHKTRTLSKLSGVSKSSKGTSEEESESAEESGRKAKAKAEAQEDEDEEELAAQEEEDEVGDDDLKGLILWTTQAKKLKHSREAMSLAAGPATKAIGALTPEVQKRRLEELGRKYLDEYHLHHDVNTQLHDIRKLVRYKCARTWLPRLELWLRELMASLNEQRVHMLDRRKRHLDCIKYTLQLCERIFFSLTDFLTWQEEVFQASWSVEDSCAVPPTTKRFLPYRGDVDELARTPRDEDDAAQLAKTEGEGQLPAASVVTGALTEDQSGRGGGVTFTNQEGDFQDNVGLESNANMTNANLTMGTQLDMTQTMGQTARQFQKLDRTLVWSKIGSHKDPRAEKRLMDLAKHEVKQAQAMTHSLFA